MPNRSQRHLRESTGYDSTGYTPYRPQVVGTPTGSGNVSAAFSWLTGSPGQARIAGFVSWGDGTSEAVTGTPMTHHYTSTGDKTITWSPPYGPRATHTPTIT